MPNRMIKETLRTSRNVNSLTDFQFRVWVHLISYVDDFGRGSADAELLKGLLFPRRHGVTVKQIQDAIGTLASKGMVILYESDGEPYFYFPKWGEHQRIRNKVSKFPEPAADCGELPQVAADCGELPLETKPNQVRNQVETNQEAGTNTHAQESSRSSRSNDPELAKVMSFFLDRINPTPSQMCIEDLKSYTASLGADVVLHAFGIALDSRKLDFRYIRGILQSYERDGLKNMEAVLEAEQRHNSAKKQQSQPQKLKQQESYDLRYMVEWPEGSGQWKDWRTIPDYDKR